MLLKKDEKSFEILPEGQHLLICYLIADLGDIPESYQGQAPKNVPKILFSFEAPGRTMVIEGAPSRLRHSEEFTASLNSSANLRKALIGWRNLDFTADEEEGFDPFSMLGKALMATVIHKKAKTSGKMRAEIAAWAPVPADVSVTAPENKLIKFDWNAFSRDVMMSLPEWIQNKIKLSSQYLTGVDVQMAAQDVNSQEQQPAGAAAGADPIPPPITAPGQSDFLAEKEQAEKGQEPPF